MSLPPDRLAERLAALSPRQRAILEERLRAEGLDIGELAGIPPGEELAGIPPAGERPFYPLSFPQQRIWFLEQLAPGRAIFATPAVLRLVGPLAPAALRQAVREAAHRHGVLRTAYPVVDGVPVQQVAPPGGVDLLIVDLSGLPGDRREAESARAVGDEAWRPIDLARDAVFRPVLVRLGPEDHVLLLALHHIAGDYWSISILLRELAQLYAALLAGQRSPLPPLPLQYTDFAVWQRGRLQGEALERELDFWAERLGSPPPPPLELPADRPRPRIRSHRGGSVPVELPLERIAGLKELARRGGATLFMALLAGFKALLLRYTGRADLVVGAPTANRTRVELEPLVGCFINMLALRTDLSGDPSFAEALDRVRQTVLAGQAHQEVPFDRVVERLRPDRSLGVTPLFQVSFVLQNTPQGPAQLPGVELRPVELSSRKAELDLAVSVWETPQGLRGLAELDAERFEPETVRRLIAHLGHLLEGAVRAPGTRLSDLPLLGQAERREILEDWSRGPLPETPAPPFLERLQEWVERTPDAAAMEAGEEILSYRELARRAQRLAHHLKGFGVGPDVPVGLFLERSADAVVAILAVLQAGGAWLPIDPGYPQERVGALLADSGVMVVVTRRELAEILPGRAMAVCLEEVDEEVAEAAEEFSPPAVPPECLAYVIYTSGSTGRPKGVLVTHCGLANLARAQAERFGIEPGSRVLQFASLTFDASVSENLVTLAAGATLVLARREEALPGPDLVRLLRERRIDTATLPPSALAALPWEPLPDLRTLAVAGEACPPELAAVWARGRRFLNAYGPTESTVCATVAEVTGSEPRLPIGRPIAGIRAVALDAGLHPVPALVPGELALGGAGLARGYLGRPDLTAERFVPDAGGEPGSRLYRTGDLVRWLPGGELDFLGRVDRQVKVRGVRIEPAEVEEALRAHPGVASAVALALPELGGSGLRLAAYYVADNGSPPPPSELRRHLLDLLPELMVPSVLVPLAELPLTPSGKVDRAALPSPEGTRTAEAGYVEPRTPLERTVAAVWREVLGVERVGARDNFFDLGGHSLLATQVVLRLREAVGADLAVWMLFENPTPAALALAIEAARPAGPPPPPLIPVSPDERAAGLPLSFAQQRLWFLDRLQPASSAYNQPVALRLSGPLDGAALERSLGEIVRRHEALRTVFGAEPVQRVLPTGAWTLPRVDLAGLPAEQREAEALHLAAEEGERPFDLQQGPLLRALLLRLADQDHAALLTTHHVVSDGWSLGILVREVGELYAAYCDGLPSPLPELPVQYGDVAVWQRRWLQGDVLAGLLAYWRDELAGAPAGLDLPTDRPRPAVRGSRGDRRRALVPPAILEPLQGIGRQAGATLFMTLLAALQAFLHRLTGAADVLVGSPVANRERRELEGLIGFFVNTLVLRGRVAGEDNFRDLLAQARGRALAAYDHQALPFERLVEELDLDRSLSQNPLFEVLFALQNAPAGPLRLAGLEWRPMEAGTIAAKLDLTLTAAEVEEGLAIAAEYPADLFDGATIERLLGHLGVLLAAVAADPEVRISELPLLSEAERRQLFVERKIERPWGGGSSPLGGGGLDQGGGQGGGRPARRKRSAVVVDLRTRPPPNLPPVPTASRPGGRDPTGQAA